jgi:hypothetical protein
MKFGYTIIYVDGVEATIAFYETAFGLKRDMVVEGEFGQLATGETKLGFAAKKMLHGPGQFASPDGKVLGSRSPSPPTTWRPPSNAQPPPAPSRSHNRRRSRGARLSPMCAITMASWSSSARPWVSETNGCREDLSLVAIR